MRVRAVQCIRGYAFELSFRSLRNKRSFLAVVEVPTVHPFHQRRASQQHRCGSTLLGRLAQVFRRPQATRMALEVGRDGTRVERVGNDAVGDPAVFDADRKQNTGGLGLAYARRGS